MDSSDVSKANKKKQKQQTPVVVPKTVTDIQRIKLERLMQDPEKPVIIPDRKKDKKAHEAPEFVRNVMGSSAGAGSGEFHVYRHLRRKEYARQKHIDEKAKKEELDDEFQKRIEDNNSKAERKTAQKRAKRPVFVLPIVIQGHKLRSILMPHQALSYIPLNLWELLGSPNDSPAVRSGEQSLILKTQLGASPSFESMSNFKIIQIGKFVQLGLEILTAARAVIDFAARQVTVGIVTKRKNTLSSNNVVLRNVSSASESLSDKFVEPERNTDAKRTLSHPTQNILLDSPTTTLKTAKIILTPCDSIQKNTNLVSSHSIPQSSLSPDTNKKRLGRSDEMNVLAKPRSNSQVKATQKLANNVSSSLPLKSILKTSSSYSGKQNIVPTIKSNSQLKSKRRASHSSSNTSRRTSELSRSRHKISTTTSEYFRRSSRQRYHPAATKRTSFETKTSALHSKQMSGQSKAMPLLPNPPSVRPVLLPTPQAIGRLSDGNNANKFGLLPTPFTTPFEEALSELLLNSLSTPYEDASPGLLPTPLSMSYEESSSGLLSRPISVHEPSFLKPSSEIFDNRCPTYSRYSKALDDKPTGLLPTPKKFGDSISSLRPGVLKNNSLNGSTRSGLLPIPRNVSVNMDYVDCDSGFTNFSNLNSETYRDDAYYSEPKSEFSREITQLMRKQIMHCRRSCNKKTTRYCPFLKMPH